MAICYTVHFLIYQIIITNDSNLCSLCVTASSRQHARVINLHRYSANLRTSLRTQLMVDYTCTVILDIGQTPGVTLHTTDNLSCARHPIIISVLLYSHNVIASGKPRSFDASLIRFIDTKIHE